MGPAADPCSALHRQVIPYNCARSDRRRYVRNNSQVKAEVLRLWKSDLRSGAGLPSSDQTYVVQLVAAQTGLSQADAQKRVDEVVAEAKNDADNARRAAAHLSFWVTAALLFGAFAASLAAAKGGVFRDGTWNGRVLTPLEI